MILLYYAILFDFLVLSMQLYFNPATVKMLSNLKVLVSSLLCSHVLCTVCSVHICTHLIPLCMEKAMLLMPRFFTPKTGTSHSCSPKNCNEEEIFCDSGKSDIGIVCTCTSLFVMISSFDNVLSYFFLPVGSPCLVAYWN